MKKLAELKRIAKTGTLEALMTIRCGEQVEQDKLPPRLQGWRKIVDSNTQGIFFLNADGQKSGLHIKKANLCEWNGETLTIYYAGARELNADEQRVFDEWKAIESTLEYQRQSEIDMLTDGSTTYYQQKRFFESKGYAYLLGFEYQKGKKYNWNTKKVIDETIKGNIEMQYTLRAVV